MCGRFAFYSPAEAVAALFGFGDAPPVEPSYNVAPTQLVVAGRNVGAGNREIALLRWGLVPFWAKDPSIGNRMINARYETAAEKPAFRDAFRKRRCIILADGFYEWRKDPHGKTPFYVSLENGDSFAFAGLWESWTDRATGESLQTASILTTRADGFMAALHDRMPVMLSPDSADHWLAGGDALPAVADAALHLRAWPVSRRVNSAANEGGDLIEPAGPAVTA